MPERFVSELAARMRASGSRVGVGEVLAAHRALAAVPPAASRDALRATLCASRRDLVSFEAAWSALTAGAPPELEEARRSCYPTAAEQTADGGTLPGEILSHERSAAVVKARFDKFGGVMNGKRNGPPAPMVKAFARFPKLSYFPARLLGLGLRPEHAPAFARRAMEPVQR